MKHIIWQPESATLVDAFNNRAISSNCRGGYIYEYQAAVALSDCYMAGGKLILGFEQDRKDLGSEQLRPRIFQPYF